MSYSGQTEYYGIPYMKAGDIVNEADEHQQLQIIDGLLYAATLGGSNCIIQDAIYTLSNTTSNPCQLTLVASGDSVITALVGRRIAVVSDPVTLTLAYGSDYYIYLRTMDGIDSDPTQCEVVALTEQNDSSSMILLAIVEYSTTPAHLNTSTGKLYLTAIQAHILDNENPHGDTLIQSTLQVTDSLTVKGNAVHGCVYKTITTGGSAGVTVQIDELTPAFASAMLTDPSIGTVTFSLDVDSITVYNTGSAGIQMTVKVEG